jgi:hypothetical protein
VVFSVVSVHLGRVRGVLTDIVANQRKGKKIHVIADNFSAHKTELVDQFLAAHSNVHMHPTYSY